MQTAATAAATANTVKTQLSVAVKQNGDGTTTPLLWNGATKVADNTTGSLTVTQTAQNAYLEWSKFDLGSNDTLTFDQSAGGTDVNNWIAFNYVRDKSANPSQIFGKINTLGLNGTVGGQVYILNANGILFGGTAQVNTHALVASSLPINTSLLQRGLLNNPDDQFLFSALAIAAGNKGPTAAFDPSVSVTDWAPDQTPVPNANGKYGDITVAPGASLSTPLSADHVGGRIMLVGANVTNAGTISTPDGQTILAAGLQVGLSTVNSSNTSDSSLRGLYVYVGYVPNDVDPSTKLLLAGTVTNADTTTTFIDDTGTLTRSSTLGVIDVERGDVTMAGATVEQLGVIESTTSVAYNGRIDLEARYNAVSSGGNNTTHAGPFFWANTGSVELGASSITQVLPETTDERTVGTTLALQSQVNIQGASVTLDGASGVGSGAKLLAPGAVKDPTSNLGGVTISAGDWQTSSMVNDPKLGNQVTSQTFVYDDGTIVLGNGALIDVSGSQTTAPVSENIISVELRGPELANSPLQRTGALRGQTIQVDIRQSGTYNGTPWVGTALADTSGYVGLIERTAQELTTDAGTVTLNAGNAVTLAKDSSINVSGGWIQYTGGYIQTTKLLTSDGHIVDIAKASPDVAYAGIYTGTNTTTDTKWGLTKTITNPLALGYTDPGYTQGGNGGTLAITAPAMTLDGTLIGQTTVGTHQVNPFVPYTTNSGTTDPLAAVKAANIDPRIWELGNQPMQATLSLTFEKQYQASGGTTTYDWYSPAPPDIYIVPEGAVVTAGAVNPLLVLSADLVKSSDLENPTSGGFGTLVIDNSSDNYKVDASNTLIAPSTVLYGTITVSADPANNITLQTAPGGSIIFDAGNITIDGGIVTPGGTQQYKAHNFWQNSPYLTNLSSNGLPSYISERGHVTLASEVTLDASGVLVDQRNATAIQPLLTAGGTITIAGSNVTLGSGSTVKVNGGALVTAAGKITYAAAGTISIQAGQDPGGSGLGAIIPPDAGLTFNVDDQENDAVDWYLKPLQGYSGQSSGGTLSLLSSLVQVVDDRNEVTAPDGTLVLSAKFFNQGGFNGFTINGLGRTEIDAATNKPARDAAGNLLCIPAVDIEATDLYSKVQSIQLKLDPTGPSWKPDTSLLTWYTPVNLSFGAKGVKDPSNSATLSFSYLVRGDLLVGKDALIETDPGTSASVALTGQTVAVLGSIITPGGKISITGGNDASVLFDNGATIGYTTVDLGPKSFLSTAGATVYTNDIHGHTPGTRGYINTGSVLPGNSITVSGNIVAEPGAILDVSGWSDTKDAAGLLQLAPVFSGSASTSNQTLSSLTLVPTVVDSDAGTITFKGGQNLLVEATLRGQAGGTNAMGGTLEIRDYGSDGGIDSILSVSKSIKDLPVKLPVYASGETAIGHAVLDANGKASTDLAGFFAVESFSNSVVLSNDPLIKTGGFDSLILHGTVNFQGAIDITAKRSLTIGDSGVISATGAVTLSAPYVALGQAYVAPSDPMPPVFTNPTIGTIPYAPTYGIGSLTVTAVKLDDEGNVLAPGLVDIGNLSLQSIGQAKLVAVDGDIRGYGTLDIAGALTLQAGQIYPVTAENFTIAANGYTIAGDSIQYKGSVTFLTSGTGQRQTPLSAGGTLSVFASTIEQGGTLRAPFGTINLGWDGTGTAPIATDPITGNAPPITQSLTLQAGSTTSVSGQLTDPTTGATISIPYGIDLNGTTWVDPAGKDITSSGLPAKTVSLSAATLNVDSGATIDTSGGGDLLSYQFISGTGGTKDILSASSSSFAVVPSYQANYAPYASYNTSADSTKNLASGDAGYVSSGSSLKVGDKIHIDLNNGLGAQDYTLLPARYALLPGAYLVTLKSTTAIAPSTATVQPDGSSIVAGYRYNAYDPTHPLYAEYEVASSAVVTARAQYVTYSANDFYTANATAAGTTAPRLPVDGGRLSLEASGLIAFQGSVAAKAAPGGRGGLIDISSPKDIVINDTGVSSDTSGTDTNLYLNAEDLRNFDSGSLLVGGTRASGSAGTTVTVTTSNLTVANDSNKPLEGSDIILVANNNLRLKDGAVVQASDPLSGSADPLLISRSLQLQPTSTDSNSNSITLSRGGTGIVLTQNLPSSENFKVNVDGYITSADGTQVYKFTKGLIPANYAKYLLAGSTITLNGPGIITAVGTGAPISLTLGDGALLRVSSYATAQRTRSSVSSTTAPNINIGAATVNGASVTIDSTNAATIAPNATVGGGTVSLASGQISLMLDSNLDATAATNATAGSLILYGTALTTLQANSKALSFLSYSSIDTYGTNTFGDKTTLASLALHTAQIRGFGLVTGDSVKFAAQTITLDNLANGTAVASTATPAGTIVFDANTLNLGVNQMTIDNFATVNLIASDRVLTQGVGELTTKGDLTVTTPLLTASAGASQTLKAGGVLKIDGAATPGTVSDRGATLILSGASVSVDSAVVLPSGKLSITATGSNTTDGVDLKNNSTLNVGGTSEKFNDVTGYTDAGQISLSSANGNINVDAGAYLNLSAQAEGGAAGSLTVSAPNGTFTVGSAYRPTDNTVPTLDARNGQGGIFSLDVATLSKADGSTTASLGDLELALKAGNFEQSQTIRVRTGNVVVDGTITAHTVNLSADDSSKDAGSITVTGTGVIDASSAATGYNTGGTIDLAANGSVVLEDGANLTVAAENYDDAGKGGSVTLETRGGETYVQDSSGSYYKYDFSKALDIQSGSTIDLSVINNRTLLLNSSNSSNPSSVTIPTGQKEVYFPSGTPGNDQVSLSSSDEIDIVSATGVVTQKITNTTTTPYVTTIPQGSTVVFTKLTGGTIKFESGSGGSIPFNLPSTLVGLVMNNYTDLGKYNKPDVLTSYYSYYNTTGTLHLRAPQMWDDSGLVVSSDPTQLSYIQIKPIGGTIKNASSIVVEGYRIFDLTETGGNITDATFGTDGSQASGGIITDAAVNVEASVQDNGGLFAGVNEVAIKTTLFGDNADLKDLAHIRPGAEIVNRTGDLSLSTTWDFAAGAFYNGGDPALASNWDLSAMAYRFGSNLEPGYLTLRAKGDLNFSYSVDEDSGTTTFGSLNDGFSANGGDLYTALLLPAGTQSWSYRLVSGADLGAADTRTTSTANSVVLGLGAPVLNNNTEVSIQEHYQTIRTGTGDIGIYSGGSVQIENNLATIYTAGTQTDPLENFDLPSSEARYAAQYTTGGGNVTIVAQGNIEHVKADGTQDSSLELPVNWLNRRGWVDATNSEFGSPTGTSIIDSTSWWIDFSNFFEGVGALGGGNVTLVAGGSISNIDAVVPTNQRTTNQTSWTSGTTTTYDKLAADQTTLELGGGDLIIHAGKDIDGGVYYVERGQGSLSADGSIHTNSTRVTLTPAQQTSQAKVVSNKNSWLPTTLFLGDGAFNISARGDVLLGPVANPFLLPLSSANGAVEETFFSTYATSDQVTVSSLMGNVTLKDSPDSSDGSGGSGSLIDWLNLVLFNDPANSNGAGTVAKLSEHWLSLLETSVVPFKTVVRMMPSSLAVTAFDGDINLVGSLTLSPSARGQVALTASGSINGVRPNAVATSGTNTWGSSMINLSDADPESIPSLTNPLALSDPSSTSLANLNPLFSSLNSLFLESGSTTGAYASIQTKQALHGSSLLHADDSQPVQLYATTGDISGLTLYAGKSARVVAGEDITDLALYVQNNLSTDVSTVIAGRDIILYDPTSPLRTQAQTTGNALGVISKNSLPASGDPTAGDLQIGGLGTLEVLAGGNLDLGINANTPTDGTSVGITSIGNTRNPSLPASGGASIIAVAGLSGLNTALTTTTGLASADALNFNNFISQFCDPTAASTTTAGANAARYLPELATMLGLTTQQVSDALLPQSDDNLIEQRDQFALDVFYLVLRDAGRDRNNPDSANYKTYTAGYQAIQTLFTNNQAQGATGDITLAKRLIETKNGGDISLLAPGGQVIVGRATDTDKDAKADQGILTAQGGNISIFANNNVSLGKSRIFTLKGGNEIIWSTVGNIAAGFGSKTVHSAPPTRVLIDPQSGDVQNDLAGLATGSGIGVLATLAGVAPGDVDLIAPTGTIDAGDAGIRSSGKINVSAIAVLNSANIQSSAGTTGTPVVVAPNISGLTTASTASAGATSTAGEAARQQQRAASQQQEDVLPSIIQVEVLGYGGGEGEDVSKKKDEAGNG
jgi:filamentous hemagglutinin family protein